VPPIVMAAFAIVPLTFAVVAGIQYRRGSKGHARVMLLLAVAVATAQMSRLGDSRMVDAVSIALTLAALAMAWRYNRNRSAGTAA
jgi:hypothetical protein